MPNMSDTCCSHETPAPNAVRNLPRYRRVLWVALLLNLAMFAIEILAGVRAQSSALLADAIDFAGDALNYGVSLAVLSAALQWRARAAMLKAVSMMGFGVFVLGDAAWGLWQGTVPHAPTMGGVGALALCVNLGVAWLLYAFREGDANMRSVWLCSRNDAIGNVAVMLAAAVVAWSGQGWPDVLVAVVMAALALQGGASVLRQARGELHTGATRLSGVDGEGGHARHHPGV